MIVAFPRHIHLCEFEMEANSRAVGAKADLCRLVGTLLFSEHMPVPTSNFSCGKIGSKLHSS